MQWSLPGTARRRTLSRRQRKPVVIIFPRCWLAVKRVAMAIGKVSPSMLTATISEGAGENLFGSEGRCTVHPAVYLFRAAGHYPRRHYQAGERSWLSKSASRCCPVNPCIWRMKSSCPALRREITPVRSVDGIQVGAGRRGPVTKRIQEAFFGLFTGETEDKWGWLGSGK